VPTATGTANSAFGSEVLTTLTTGASNTAVGWSMMFVATTGGANCTFGRAVLGSLTSNIAIGSGASQNYMTSESSNIVISATSTVGESSKIRIGSTQDGAFIAGICGVTTVNADAILVLVDLAGQLRTVSSSIKYKENVTDITEEESGVLGLI
jgi:hypothetical protein